MMIKLDHMTKKVFSGRWLWTLAAAIVFVCTSLDGTLPASDVKMIIGIVVTFYFTKKDAAEQ